jgi:hypothetical protein
MPAWPFVFYCLTVKTGTLIERPILARSPQILRQRWISFGEFVVSFTFTHIRRTRLSN